MKIHFAGIGGVGMAALAILEKGAGNEVSGCDVHLGARTRYLESLGIRVSCGHDAAHVANCDLLVYTGALDPAEPELLAAGEKIRRGDLLASIVSSRESIAVAGSHGKTTTTTYIVKLLKALGEDVAWAVGGETGNMPVGHCASGVLVVEADESDGSLALYHPSTLVITNCEWDHPDRFKTPEEYFALFDLARSNAGYVVEAKKLPPLPALESIPAFAALAQHNKSNARTAVEIALRRGHSLEAVLAALPSAVDALPDRRFQPIAKNVYADYAHHPTEMRFAIAMAREKTAKCSCLRVLFQPHRYSRTRAFLSDFPKALAHADQVIICPTYAAFEKPLEGGSSADLYAECRKFGLPDVHLARSCREAWHHAKANMKEGDVTLVLGAGDIIEIAGYADKPLESRDVIIGAGTNTWRSELDTGECYIKASGLPAKSGASLLSDPALASHIPWMAGIPGTVGGWIKMNAGAFGHSISEVVSRVKVDGKWLSKDECRFGYRTSAISGMIEDVEFIDCSKLSVDDSAHDARYYLGLRKNFPPGTKGSVFKNPPGDFAGRLLELAGAKGLRVGGAYVWESHANVIALESGAPASDFLALAQILRHRVHARFGVLLQYEVRGLERAEI